jgi:hypothetical protein
MKNETYVTAGLTGVYRLLDDPPPPAMSAPIWHSAPENWRDSNFLKLNYTAKPGSLLGEFLKEANKPMSRDGGDGLALLQKGK